MKLVSLIYVSKMTEECDTAALEKILEASRRNNSSNEITGVLCYDVSFFLQCLEGPKEAVDSLYSEIQRDARHKDVKLLDYREVQDRQFGSWSMALLFASKLDRNIVSKYSRSGRLNPSVLEAAEVRAFLAEITNHANGGLAGQSEGKNGVSVQLALNAKDVPLQERSNAATFQGNPLTLIGQALKIGDDAPPFHLLANDLSSVSLDDSKGKVRLILSVPSLDTPVCDMETRRFNESLDAFSESLVACTVSADLPFAQARWCGTAGVERMKTLSDHHDMNFGNAYGTHIKELRLESRAVFVIDGAGVIRYVEYVPEITNQPNYEEALAAIDLLLYKGV